MTVVKKIQICCHIADNHIVQNVCLCLRLPGPASLSPPHCFSGYYCSVFKQRGMHNNKHGVLWLHESLIHVYLKWIILSTEENGLPEEQS